MGQVIVTMSQKKGILSCLKSLQEVGTMISTRFRMGNLLRVMGLGENGARILIQQSDSKVWALFANYNA